MSELQLNQVTKRFANVAALDDLTLSVASGEFFCLLGPSAAGKTTTLRVIAGLERPDSGSVIFDGRNVTHQPVQGRGIGMIFQTFALYPHLTVRRNLAYGLNEAGQPRAAIDRRVDEVSELLKVAHTLDRLPATLSGGEQQRVAIGRAMIRRPSLLLLDEPLTNLDAKLRHDMRAEFKRLHREFGMTMLYATPDQLEALGMAERIAVLKQGKVVQVGTADEVYDNPCDTYVATLVGAPSMNLLAGRRSADPSEAPDIELSFGRIGGGPWQSALAKLAPGQPVAFGIRPHDLYPVADGARVRFPARVHMTEPLGDTTVVDLDIGDDVVKMVLAEQDAVGYRVGDRLEVALAIQNSYLFDKKTGASLK